MKDHDLIHRYMIFKIRLMKVILKNFSSDSYVYKRLVESGRDIFHYNIDEKITVKIKPPLGLIPKKIWEQKVKAERMAEVRGAIQRYLDAGFEIPRIVTGKQIGRAHV